MRFVRSLLGRTRHRAARATLASEPSPALYAEHARESMRRGRVREAGRVCAEGLSLFPGNAELSRLRQRIVGVEREERLTELKRELREAPRAALWSEMGEILLASGAVGRAEEVAREWLRATGGAEARLLLATALVQRYVADRGREIGRRAFEALDELDREAPRDTRHWRLRLELATRIGAWREGRRAAAQLLGLEPGDPATEARFRTLDARSDGAPTIEQALLRVEATGDLVSEDERPEPAPRSGADVHKALRALTAMRGARAAVYVRGATALVHGPRGATAERTARAVRSILQSSRTVARRLGLGQVDKVQLEGTFGCLALAPGEMDAGAVLCEERLRPDQESALLGLAGMDAAAPEEDTA